MRRGVKKTCRGHVFSLRSRRLCRCGQKYLVPEGTKPFYFNGAFFILAQVRGNWGGVSFTLRMITTRWVTSVPGMV